MKIIILQHARVYHKINFKTNNFLTLTNKCNACEYNINKLYCYLEKRLKQFMFPINAFRNIILDGHLVALLAC